MDKFISYIKAEEEQVIETLNALEIISFIFLTFQDIPHVFANFFRFFHY